MYCYCYIMFFFPILNMKTMGRSIYLCFMITTAVVPLLEQSKFFWSFTSLSITLKALKIASFHFLQPIPLLLCQHGFLWCTNHSLLHQSFQEHSFGPVWGKINDCLLFCSLCVHSLHAHHKLHKMFHPPSHNPFGKKKTQTKIRKKRGCFINFMCSNSLN